jgi:inorganic pyrophosphatase
MALREAAFYRAFQLLRCSPWQSHPLLHVSRPAAAIGCAGFGAKVFALPKRIGVDTIRLMVAGCLPCGPAAGRHVVAITSVPQRSGRHQAASVESAKLVPPGKETPPQKSTQFPDPLSLDGVPRSACGRGQGDRMDLQHISAGQDPPKDIHAVIEIPLGGVPVKYEIDKTSGALFVDRFLHTAMFYPGNYGFIPHTLSADGDPCDVLVVSQVPVVPGAVIRCRPVGALVMEDEAGGDEKILAVPVDALHPFYTGIRSYRDLPPIMCEQIAHFFQHYKDLEKGKWVSIVKWLEADGAEELVLEAIARAKE